MEKEEIDVSQLHGFNRRIATLTIPTQHNFSMNNAPTVQDNEIISNPAVPLNPVSINHEDKTQATIETSHSEAIIFSIL
jgi:hypothetical protein